jgi:hypothetical protein
MWAHEVRSGMGDQVRRRMMVIAAIAIFSPPLSPAQPSPGLPARARIVGMLEHRADVLATALQLDARQRAELLTILENQRRAVAKIWHDPTLSSAERAPATRAANERTGDEIRAILNDEQKRKYNPPKPSTPPEQAGTRSIEQWLDAGQPR